MPLDQANAAYLEKLRRSGMPSVCDSPIRDYRALLAAAQSKRARGPVVERVEDVAIATSGGMLPVRVYLPAAVQGAMVYLHGGGWTIGDIEGWDALCRRLANQAACAVVSVGYRLAPEHPFPVALDDVQAAIRWVAWTLPGQLGLALPLMVAGDSAGANLATAAAAIARDEGGPEIAMQILAYPVVTPEISADTLEDFLPPRLSRRELAWYVAQYVPAGASLADPRIAPLRAASHAGLPPTFILTAENDILRKQGEAYAAALVQAGVPVLARRYLGTMHGFLTVGDEISQSGEGVRDIAAFVRSVLARRAAA